MMMVVIMVIVMVKADNIYQAYIWEPYLLCKVLLMNYPNLILSRISN